MTIHEVEVGNGTVGESSRRRAHILMITLEEFGHYTVFLQLLHCLSSCDITVTFCSSERRVKELKELLGAGEFKSIDLRLVVLSDDVPQTADKLGGTPPLWDVVKTMKVQFEPYRKKLAEETNPAARATCLVADCLLSWSEELAEELQIPRYVAFVPPGWCIYTVVQASIEASKQIVAPDIVKVPGQFSAPAKDAPSIVYPLVNLRNVAGLVVNSFEELEGEEFLEAIRTDLPHMTTNLGCKVAKFLAVGPLVLTPSVAASIKNSGPQGKAIEWLDAQPPSSVVYVAFGSVAHVSVQLVLELARGLELSGVPFLWVLRPTNSAYDLSTVFPPGFLDCVKTRGFLETGWAPQVQILQHPSVGGFLSHTGWNSSIESIASGVPLLSLPLHGDQFLNSRLVVEKLKVGLPVRKPESAAPVVPAEDVAAAVRSLMIDDKGKEVRQNSKRFKELGVVATQAGGSSKRNLDELINDLLAH